MEKIINKILEKENITLSHLKKSSSGFTNQVYFINDDMVIKLTNDSDTIKQLQKETSLYKHLQLDCIPKYIASGNVDGTEYLIISRVPGNTLYSIWHTLDNTTRKDIVHKIANILKRIHLVNADFFDNTHRDTDWITMWNTRLNDRKQALIDMGYNVELLNMFIENNLETLFNENTFGLVYNDAHFDNFLYDNGTLYLIDFDRVRYCPIDYEMMIFKCMCDNPSKFASEVDDPNVKEEDYDMVYNTFKNSYPELFEIPNIENRIKVYQFNYLIRQAISIKNHTWIKELLDNFNNFVKSL